MVCERCDDYDAADGMKYGMAMIACQLLSWNLITDKLYSCTKWCVVLNYIAENKLLYTRICIFHLSVAVSPSPLPLPTYPPLSSYSSCWHWCFMSFLNNKVSVTTLWKYISRVSHLKHVRTVYFHSCLYSLSWKDNRYRLIINNMKFLFHCFLQYRLRFIQHFCINWILTICVFFIFVLPDTLQLAISLINHSWLPWMKRGGLEKRNSWLSVNYVIKYLIVLIPFLSLYFQVLHFGV